MNTVGFVGLGSQGAPMARRIVESGYPLLLWARRPETLAPFAGTRAEAASSIEDLGARAEHVGVCVVDDAGVEQVCEQLMASMRPGTRIAIHSTVHPNTVIALARRAAARAIALIDAPVSGGGPAAAARTLTVMMGGEEDAIAAARPIFETFGGLIVRVGGIGAGQTAKLVNNALMAVNLAMAHHGLSVGAALGLDRAALSAIVKASSGRSYGFDVYARLPAPRAFAHGARLLAKDLRLLGELLGADASFAAFRSIAAPFLDSMAGDEHGILDRSISP
ncbi:MAG TPA: NAD(P)-dependent oxidoreductase [Steroidobacteraceae bacterium]|nr:NAD(P)-dependent oxidoreductase [Steroidobacteraceae bacterium]